MRLLRLIDEGHAELSLHPPDKIPPYVILSHTWGDDEHEVTYRDIAEGGGASKAGYQKIRFCGERARLDGYEHFWIDSCCIDRSNSAELNEAITSMFKWYKYAAHCYVYLADVPWDGSSILDSPLQTSWKSTFRRSRWFRRGWTLQELIAPRSVEFFSAEGVRLGTKASLEWLLHEITGIPVSALRGRDMSEFTVDERRAWAGERETKREEDRAYSMLGIFNVSILSNYGEGVDNAFRRLDEEILKRALTRESTHDGRRVGASVDTKLRGGLSTEQKEAPIKTEVRKKLLNSLFFDEIDARRLTLKAAQSKTCTWFVKTEQYKLWAEATTYDKEHNLLWIKGKPGAGKSTLMKFLYSQTKQAIKGETPELVVSFFFNARGTALEKSTLGVYRSLLWQLLKTSEDLQESLDELEDSALRNIERNGWSPETIKQTMTNVVERLGHRSVQIWIDALDECDDGEVVDMISFLEDLTERAIDCGTCLKICFASRHYPTIIVRWGLQVILENEEEHRADISRYIENKLRQPASQKSRDIRSDILDKSGGVFLWVALVIPILNNAISRGRIGELQGCVDEIPVGLEDLFEMLLTRDTDALEELKLCVQWTLFANRPLLMEEYYFAVQSHENIDAAKAWIRSELSEEDMRHFIHSTSKGLVEVTRITSSRTLPTVQFIHESVRTFFLSERGYKKLWPDLDVPFIAYSHETLKLRCFPEIKASIKRAKLSTLSLNDQGSSKTSFGSPAAHRSNSDQEFERKSVQSTCSSPLLAYANDYILYHANMAESASFRQQLFLDEYRLVLSSRYKEAEDRTIHTECATILHEAAKRNLPKIVRLELESRSNEGLEGEIHDSALRVACRQRSFEAIMVFLAPEAEVDLDADVSMQLSRLSDIQPWDPIVTEAAEKGCAEVIRLLLAAGRVNLCSEDLLGRSPLSHAAEGNHVDIVRMLLDTGNAEPNLQDCTGRTAISYAAWGGHLPVVQLLLDTSSVNPDLEDFTGRSPLSYAAEAGYMDIVQMLLDTQCVDAGLKDSLSRTPLLYAACEGHTDIVRTLLGIQEAAPDSMDCDLRTPLSYAASHGHLDTVKVLLATENVAPDQPDKDGRTPLSHAAESGHLEVVDTLLSTQADPNSSSLAGLTPLMLTARAGYQRTVRLLLEMGADPNVTDLSLTSALMYAAQSCNVPGAQALLIAGANVHQLDKDGNSALLLACKMRSPGIPPLHFHVGTSRDSYDTTDRRVPTKYYATRISRMLLDANANPDQKNFSNQSPLMFAAACGYHGVVELLLNANADPSICSPCNETALSLAVSIGHEDIVRLLLDRGADPDPSIPIDAPPPYPETVLDKARRLGKNSIINMLQDAIEQRRH